MLEAAERGAGARALFVGKRGRIKGRGAIRARGWRNWGGAGDVSEGREAGFFITCGTCAERIWRRILAMGIASDCPKNGLG